MDAKTKVTEIAVLQARIENNLQKGGWYPCPQTLQSTMERLGAPAGVVWDIYKARSWLTANPKEGKELRVENPFTAGYALDRHTTDAKKDIQQLENDVFVPRRRINYSEQASMDSDDDEEFSQQLPDFS